MIPNSNIQLVGYSSRLLITKTPKIRVIVTDGVIPSIPSIKLKMFINQTNNKVTKKFVYIAKPAPVIEKNSRKIIRN
jgi:hypothetical protein